MFHYPVTTGFWRGVWDLYRVRGTLRKACDWNKVHPNHCSYNNPTCEDCLAYKLALTEKGDKLLIITEAAKQNAAEIVALTSRYKNWTVPGYTAPDPSVVNQQWTFFEPSIRADFCWIYLVQEQKVYRQLSIRHAKKGKLPPLEFVCTIASWFGFTSPGQALDLITKPGPDWGLTHMKEHDTTVIIQEIPYAEYSRFL